MTYAGDFVDVYDIVDGEFKKIGRGLVTAAGSRAMFDSPAVDLQFGGEVLQRPVQEVKLAARVEQLERVLREVDDWADYMGGFEIQEKIKRALGDDG